MRRLASQTSWLLLALLLLASCGTPSQQPAAPSSTTSNVNLAAESRLLDTSGDFIMPNVGAEAPDFEYTLSDGTTQRLSDLRGKKVILNFWATWCEPCLAEMPDLDRIVKEHSDIVVLGINKLETPETIGAFASTKLDVSFLLIANTDGAIANRYAARNIPTSFFINSDGTIGARRIGVMTHEFMQSQVDLLH
jgi:cytochrome c biogenesis protein CcmG/thiol:disulfide interchange protein DsbE